MLIYRSVDGFDKVLREDQGWSILQVSSEPFDSCRLLILILIDVNTILMHPLMPKNHGLKL